MSSFEVSEVSEEEAAAYRRNAAMSGAAVAVTAFVMGISIGRLALVVTTPDDVALASGVLDEIGLVVESEEAISSTPMSLLIRYAAVLQAGEEADHRCYSHLRTVAKHVIASTFPRPLVRTWRGGQKAIAVLEAKWLECLRDDSEVLAEDMGREIAVLAYALEESGIVSAEDAELLVARVCFKHKAA
jgi:hypothetical protein